MNRILPVEQIPTFSNELSNEELLKFVRHYYPNLNGALSTLVKRFEWEITGVENYDHSNSVEPKAIIKQFTYCPHCGSHLKLQIIHNNSGNLIPW